MESIDMRGMSRLISFCDLVLSFGVTVIMAVMIVLVTIWDWHLESKDSVCDNKTSNEVATPSSFIFGDIKTYDDLLIQWLFWFVIFLVFMIRSNAAYLLYKGTTKNKPPRKAILYCSFWMMINLCYMVIMSWLVYERYAGTFSNNNAVSPTDFYSHWISMIAQIVAVGVVAGFVWKLARDEL